jgi:hypothetical protein
MQRSGRCRHAATKFQLYPGDTQTEPSQVYRATIYQLQRGVMPGWVEVGHWLDVDYRHIGIALSPNALAINPPPEEGRVMRGASG